MDIHDPEPDDRPVSRRLDWSQRQQMESCLQSQRPQQEFPRPRFRTWELGRYGCCDIVCRRESGHIDEECKVK